MKKKHILFAFATFLLTSVFSGINAQNTIGGHFGFIQPIVTFQDGDTSDGFDPYTVGFPIGVTVRKSEKFAFDVEIVPFISSVDNAEGDSVTSVNELLIHPGLLWGLGNSYTFGNRIAYETQSGRYGITPLLNKGFKIGETNVFAEFVLPLRVGNDQDFSVTAGLHFGVGF